MPMWASQIEPAADQSRRRSGFRRPGAGRATAASVRGCRWRLRPWASFRYPTIDRSGASRRSPNHHQLEVRPGEQDHRQHQKGQPFHSLQHNGPGIGEDKQVWRPCSTARPVEAESGWLA